MLQPDQFEVNEAWIAFKLNDAPLHTITDGDFDFFAVMDAANRLILGAATVPTEFVASSVAPARRFLEQAQEQADELPKTLFMPADHAPVWLADEAQMQGITVVEVPIDQLLLFIGDARRSFREKFGTRLAS